MTAAPLLLSRRAGGALHLTLNRPDVRNAMSLALVEELRAAFLAARGDRGVRAVVLRGTGGHFCAGADLEDLAQVRGDDPLPFLMEYSRAFGRLVAEVDAVPQVVLALLEGAVLGGGLGLACVADVAIAEGGAVFALPETTRGLPPAQIGPFVVRRIGLSQARRLALLGRRFGAEEALALGLVHETVSGARALEAAGDAALADVRRCAPGANAATKSLLRAAVDEPAESLLDRAAQAFAEAAAGPEGREGGRAFAEKRPPSWVDEW